VTPTTAADHPQARAFLDRLRVGGPASGLRLLYAVVAAGGNHARATDQLRALEDRGLVRCLGPDPAAPSVHRGELVGQLYEARR
jgi:hypothetical protein